jgi:hypothetical protein
MDIPNDLTRLLARLQEVTRGTDGTAQTGACGSRPNEIEINCFLSQYNFDPSSVIERVEVSRDGAFEFYLFAVSNRSNNELSLLAMWPKSEAAGTDGP